MFGLSTIALKAIALALILAALAGIYAGWVSHQRDIGRAEVQAKWDADKLEKSKAALRIVENNTRVTGELQAKADKLRESKNAQIHSIELALAESLQRLRNRPERPPSSDGVPSNTSAGSGCTGASLYAADGEFLIREAARADKLRLRAETCESAYRAARDAQPVAK